MGAFYKVNAQDLRGLKVQLVLNDLDQLGGRIEIVLLRDGVLDSTGDLSNDLGHTLTLILGIGGFSRHYFLLVVSHRFKPVQ